MPVRSRILDAGFAVMNNTIQTAYTVPADRTAILKDVRLRIVGNAADVWIYAYDGATHVAIFKDRAGAAADTVLRMDPPPWVVLEEGHQIRFYSAGTDTVFWWLSGALLEGDPA